MDQEEDAIPLLEGFQWDTLVDMPTSRKRSLSESSVAQPPAHSLFTSLVSNETDKRDALGSERQGASVSPHPIFAQGNKDSRQKKTVERMLDRFEARAQKQPDELTSAAAKALRRSDSVLGDSSSGTELCDGQGTGKRRRAARVSRGNGVKGEPARLQVSGSTTARVGKKSYLQKKADLRSLRLIRWKL